MTTNSYTVCNKEETARLIDFPSLVKALESAVVEYACGQIVSPERMVVPLPTGGVMLSMPAIADDLAIHKLVCVQPQNKSRNLPTLHGQVSVSEAMTGQSLFILDGPEVTGRRTAAISMLGIRAFAKQPKTILLIGTGTQAAYHLQAINSLYPEAQVKVKGSSELSTQTFCERHHVNFSNVAPADLNATDYDVVITLTTSLNPVWNEAPFADRLIIGVGAFRPEMAEIGPHTLNDSLICVDDPVGAQHEAGDLIQAGTDWNRVIPLVDILKGNHTITGPVVFKSVGTGAWDLAACRVAYQNLKG